MALQDFNGLAGQRENLAVAAWFTPLGRDDPERGREAHDKVHDNAHFDSANDDTFLKTPIRLSVAFAGASGGAFATGAALAPDLPRTSMDAGISPLDVIAARGMKEGRKTEALAGLAGAAAGAFQSANAPAQQAQAPAITAAQQAFLNKMNTDPKFAQDFVNNVNAITTALDQPKSVGLKTYETVNANVDIGKIDEDNQRNFCQADDAKAGVDDLKNMMEAHAEEMKAAEGPPDPTKPPAAVPTPVQGAFTMSANEVQSPEEAVQVAAHGRGTHGAQSASEFTDDAAPGYTGVSAMAAQPAQAKPAGEDGRMFIHGPGLTDEGGKSRVAMTADGKLEIDGMGMEQLENNINTIHRDSKMAAENMDTIATRGVTTGLDKAIDLVHNGGLDPSQVNVHNNGTAQVFQLARGNSPGGMA